ncbi:MAG TPA: substrate-binding domain-containing protein [Candidatus Avoscillospira stercoripullorum]|uniref:Substrate-binding domain-containing protein n=1 Tax=Candidatus Avoscillospira stercoripullorum TaxID=2840709 RepID=A0A9D1A8U1_9FIRM|nr:substrate-binding domain-containing protein [Candidatus Avoscillospira stercoripullorum]
MKKLLSILLALLLVASLAACTTPAQQNSDNSAVTVIDAETDTEMEEADDAYTIAMIYQDLSQEFNIYFQNVLRTRCEEAGITLMEFDGKSDTETQLNQCENAISSGVDALMFIPYDKDGAAPIIDNCNDAGIPVICCNNVTSNVDEATAYIGANDIEAGIMETEYIVELLGGKGNIAVVEGPFGHSAQVARQEGIEQVLADYPDCQIVLDDTANWNRDEAMELVENWLAGGTQIDAIICHNDIMAMGALQACQDSNLDIPIIGIDATYDALCAVKDGTLAADVYQDVYGQAEEAFNVCVRILNGTDYEKTTYVPFQLITQENVDEYLENF